jgi:Tol biopolymer transport system component
VRDLKTNRTVLASRAQGRHGAAANGDSSNPSISADGRYVAFESYASNLGPADNGTVPDVFVRDLRSGRVFLASRGADGGPAANAPSADPSISSDGRFVAFDSRGSNLSPADTLHATSCFPERLLSKNLAGVEVCGDLALDPLQGVVHRLGVALEPLGGRLV